MALRRRHGGRRNKWRESVNVVLTIKCLRGQANYSLWGLFIRATSKQRSVYLIIFCFMQVQSFAVLSTRPKTEHSGMNI